MSHERKLQKGDSTPMRIHEAESNGDNPSADNAEEGNDDAEESGDDDTDAEGSLYKDSAAADSNEQVGDSEPATTPEERTTKYDYRIEEMKGIRKLRNEEKVLHFQWMENIIAEDKEGVE
ncbi:hypothetical protein HAX54_051367 [Datura stramonium]|uniref:Uncharacterized protein n=1 Tax=Datura stramonium TaxID=4076 RepID=A0ABS8SY26_DATST|nr:hypothetical protein [Datura stramonium]